MQMCFMPMMIYDLPVLSRRENKRLNIFTYSSNGSTQYLLSFINCRNSIDTDFIISRSNSYLIMRSTLLSFIFILCFVNLSSAQVIGTDSVCPGYIYNYSVVISGADSISWSFPTGWQILQNNGAQVQVFCNVNAGQICAIGFDSAGNNVGNFCKNVVWQGGGGSWHIDVVQHPVCQCYTATASVVPDSSPQPCTCTGTPSSNLHYAYYNNPWPTGQFRGYIDSPVNLNAPVGSPQTYYVYLIDVTFGIQNAVRIQGGSCAGTIVNSFTLPNCFYMYGNLTVTPASACVGDTVTVQYTHNLEQVFSLNINSYSWQIASGSYGTLVPPITGLDHVRVILDSIGTIEIVMSVFSSNNQCMFNGFAFAYAIQCTYPPTALFYPQNPIEICVGPSGPNGAAVFTDSSALANSYQWFFPGGSPASSTLQNPPNIYYYTPGTYDVTLIVTNPLGSDTLIRQNCVIVNPLPAPVITILGDTLHAGSGYQSYQWYFGNIPLTGATDSIYVVNFSGSYSVAVTNSFNCTSRSDTVQITITDIAESAENKTLVYFDEEYRELRINDIQCKEFSVFDITGREINRIKGNYFNASGLPYGVYLLQYIKGNKIVHQKFLIRKF
jgi:hypothetical protein